VADLYYYEQGYIDDGYHVYIANAVIEISPYIEDGYIEAGYYDDYSAQSGLVCDAEIVSGELVDASGTWTTEFAVTATVENIKQFASSQNSEFAQTTAAGRILETGAEFTGAFTPTLTADAFKNHTAILDTVSTLSVDAVANRSANVLLEHIADLNAMAAKTAVSSATMAASASQSTQAQQTSSAQSQLTSLASINFNGGRRNLANAVLNSQFAIPRLTVFKSYERPLMLKQSVGTITIDTSVKQFGAGSLFWNGTNRYLEYYYSRTVPTPIRGQIVDFWIKRTSTNANSNILTFNDGTRDYIRLFIGSGDLVTLQFHSTSTRTITSSQALDSNWNHVAVAWDSDSARTSLYVNGQRQGTLTFIPSAVSAQQLLRIGNNTSNTSTVNLDEVRYLAGGEGFAAAQGFDPNSTTCTVPSAQAINTDNTNALFHFNTDFSDDVSGIRSFEAQLSATAALTAQANANIKTATAAVTATASLSVVIGRQQPAEAQLEAAQTLAVTVSKFVGITSDANTSTTVTAVIGSIRSFEIQAGSLFTPQVDVEAQLAGVALLESQATIIIDAVKSTDIIAPLTTESAQSTTATVTAGLASALSSDTTVTATVTRIQPAAADLTAEFTLVEITDKIAGLAVLANSLFTQTTTADKLKIVTVALASESQVTVTAVKTTDINSTQNSEFAQNADNVRVRFADSQQSAQAEITTDAVKTVSVISDQSALTTQTTTAVKSVDAIPQLESIATQLTVAFQNATGTVTLSSTATLSAIIGSIKQFPLNQITGLGATSNQYGVIGFDQSLFPPPVGSTAILRARAQGWTFGVWVKRDTITGEYQCIAEGTVSSNENNGGIVLKNSDVRIRTNFDPDEPGGQWNGVAPTDSEWHHYLFRTRPPAPGDIVRQWNLWIDGVYQGLSSQNSSAGDLNFAGRYGSGEGELLGGLRLGNGSIIQESGFAGGGPNNLLGGVAQVWMGFTTDTQFRVERFYSGFVDMGSAGTSTGLPTPVFYNVLTQPYTGVTWNAVSPVPSLASTPLGLPSLIAQATVLVGITTAVLSVSNQVVTTELVANAVVIRSGQSSLESNFASTAQGLGIFGITANFTSNASLTATPFRIKQFASTLTSEATITAIVGATEQFDSNLNSEFTLEIDVEVKPPIRIEADLSSTVTLTADVSSFTDSITLMVSFGELTADVTVIPPIRIEADLESEFTVTAIIGSVEQFAVLTASSGTLDCDPVKTTGILEQFTSEFTQSTDTFKFTGIVADFLAFNTQLTLGEVINIDPYLQLKIKPEHRALKILQETRVKTIESETRVNTIKE
jgi:hypothetical protein